MEPIAYLHLQLRLEGKAVIQDRFIRQVEIVQDEKLPLVLIAQLAGTKMVTYYDEAIEAALQERLSAIDLHFPDVVPLLDVLQAHHIQSEAGHYRTYIFPSRPAPDGGVLCLAKQDARVKAFGFDGFAEQVYAIEAQGMLVSACVSTRENERCGEAWVYTSPEYRKQGFAQRVVGAWADGLIEAGRVPFYSHEIRNEASAKLAGKLGLLPVFEEITIAQI